MVCSPLWYNLTRIRAYSIFNLSLNLNLRLLNYNYIHPTPIYHTMS